MRLHPQPRRPFEHECGLTGNVLEDSKALVFFFRVTHAVMANTGMASWMDIA